MPNDPQVPWTDEQWARVNQVIQEEAKRARVAATFLPLIRAAGRRRRFRAPARDFFTAPTLRDRAHELPRRRMPTRRFSNTSNAIAAEKRLPNVAAAQASYRRGRSRSSDRQALGIDDRDTMRLATLQVIVPVRNAQMADPGASERAGVVSPRRQHSRSSRGRRGLQGTGADPPNPSGYSPPGGSAVCRAFGKSRARWKRAGFGRAFPPPGPWIVIPASRSSERGQAACCARYPTPLADWNGVDISVRSRGAWSTAVSCGADPGPGSLVLPQDRIIPFLGGGPLLRSSTLEARRFTGVVVALGGAPIELVVATDMCLQFLQVTSEPLFFRVSEKIALRIREPDAIVQLAMTT